MSCGSVGVLIPALNEEVRIAHAIASAREAGADEIIVADGGSRDRTVERAREAGATVILGDPIRGRCLNQAAAAAQSDLLIILHADTTLPPGAADDVRAALQHAVFGGFRLRFAEPGLKLRVAEMMINLRTRITRAPWGDQAQFIRRQHLLETGGFLEEPIMEDYELAIRMKKRGKTRLLPSHVVTSGRRFLEKGVLLTALTNWRIVAAWRRGASPAELAHLYRGRGPLD